MTRFSMALRALGVAAAGAGVALMAAPLADSALAARGHSYLVGNHWMFVNETRYPGEIDVHVGATAKNNVSYHSQIVQTFGDIPFYPDFRDAAERYVASIAGRCQIVGHKPLTLGEMRFFYECR